MVQVDAAEGRDLSRRHDAFAFHEVSVADQPSATVDVMNSMVAEIWKEKVNGESAGNTYGREQQGFPEGMHGENHAGDGLLELMPHFYRVVLKSRT